MGVVDDPVEFGKRVSAARSYAGLSQPEFAKRMGYKEARSTTERWERGDLGKRRNNPEGRREVAHRIIEKTGCPPSFFGFSEPAEGADLQERLDELDERLWLLAQKTLDEGELADFEQASSSDPRSEEKDPGEAND